MAEAAVDPFVARVVPVVELDGLLDRILHPARERTARAAVSKPGDPARRQAPTGNGQRQTRDACCASGRNRSGAEQSHAMRAAHII